MITPKIVKSFLRSTFLSVILIMLLASALRLAFLGSYPASLYWEEVALGYDAYSIAMTGSDVHGNTLPLVAFKSFGDYKPSGYFYALAPVMRIFGLVPFAVRLPSALAGIGTVFLAYLIGKNLFNRRVGLWASFLLAITPWHIHFSRAGFEVNLATFFLTLSVYFLTLKKCKTLYLASSVLFVLLSAYTYHGMRVLAPLLFMLAGVMLRSRLKFKRVVLGAVAITIGLLPLLLNISQPEISQRFSETSIFSTSDAVQIANERRALDGNTLLSRIWHHRYWYWTQDIVEGYLAHFDLQFLFLRGDDNPRHQSSFVGLMYLWMLPLVLIGAYQFRRTSSMYILVGWLALAAIPPALTKTTPHTLRFLPAVVPLLLFAALGIAHLARRKVFSYGCILLSVFSVSIWAYDYAGRYAITSSNDWQYGYRQVVEFVADRRENYDAIYFTRALGRPSAYYWFFADISPSLVQEACKNVAMDQGEFLAFENIRFENSPANIAASSLVVSHEQLADGNLVFEVSDLENRPAFYVYEY